MQLLRIERAKRKVTQREAAKHLGVHWRTYHQWEVGRVKPNDRENILAIAEWTSTDAGEVLRMIDQPVETDEAPTAAQAGE